MRVQFIGCGDAFGSGGRFQTCFHVTGRRANFLIDCGASSLIALKARKIDLNSIKVIFITHFHADHFGGVPFFILDAQFFSKRKEPLTIFGPKGLSASYDRVMETAFPGSSATAPKFELNLVELEPCITASVDAMRVLPFRARHGETDGAFFSYRFEMEDRVIAYSGDTEWTDDLIKAGAGADLFISEAYFYEKQVKYHLNLATIIENLHRIQPKRLILTHMSEDMLKYIDQAQCGMAYDGLSVEI